MGEIADAVRVIADLGRQAAAGAAGNQVGSTSPGSAPDAGTSGSRDSDSEIKLKMDLVKWEAGFSFAKVVAVVAGVVLTMWLAGDRVVRLLRPKPIALLERIELFVAGHTVASAAEYLATCEKELAALRTGVRAEPPTPAAQQPAASQASPQSPADAPVRVAPRQVARLRIACGELMGE